ncbi:hypothetical protein EC844_12341 [Acinetobacter calcoaceticus]|uniref:Quercetin 2,3-dioxygenase n=1 Tax=Acinetobacter calcoaceticus TaxID=471 RepID=A0A4R1XFV7_ACICA|nr:hypothetical protein EC844_12341 [Acinetobacter calcoaceticus]
MTQTNVTEISYSEDCDHYAQQHMQAFPLRNAEIGRGTIIKRAIPSRHKRMIGAWCFLDHAGPVHFAAGEGLDVGPHPHIGLQTFTWMIEGTMMHRDSLGSAQLIRPKQVNLMTAGCGISHTEVAPENETAMHSVQLWIALPDHKIDMPPQFDHYPELPVVEQDQIEFTVLVGEFLGATSPVQVHSELVGVDMITQTDTETLLQLNPAYEYGVMVLEGTAQLNGQELDDAHIMLLEPGLTSMRLNLPAQSRVILVGGVPFESPILLWWNFVGRTQEELAIAREDWINQSPRFGSVPEYHGARLIAPAMPERMRPSK